MGESTFQKLRRFPRVYWVVQSFELLERGAYYTMMPIIVVYCLFNVGMPVWLSAMITMFMYPFQYGLPIFTGALAEKVGYRKQIIFSFIVLSLAYFSMAIAFNSLTMIMAVIAVGIGIGSYKPLVSATVAKCTTGEDRNLAYSMYYWIVNLGAFVFPLIYVGLELAGIMNSSMYYLVFVVGGLFVGINIITALFFFKEVPRSGEVKTVGDVIYNIKVSFKDKKFVVMIFLIGGFWALYSSFLNALPLVLFGFGLVPKWFTPMFLGVFNPLTIILLGLPLTKVVEKVESLRALMAGVLIYLIGLTIIAVTLQVYWVIIGIITASIGEFLVAPGYLSFVSKLAPKDKVSAYIGTNFLATFLGLFFGTVLFGGLVTIIAVDMSMPHFFYGILLTFGALILIGFMVYYNVWGQDIIERAKRIEAIENGISPEEIEKSSSSNEPIIFRVFDRKSSILIPAIFIPIILILTYSQGTNYYIGNAPKTTGLMAFNIDDYKTVEGRSDLGFSGTLNEGDTESKTVTVTLDKGQLLKSITFTLTWTDEPDYKRIIRTWQNQPDEFTLSVAYGDELNKTASGANVHGEEGKISITFEFQPSSASSTDGVGDWNVSITLDDAGDFTNNLSPISYADTSNDYNLAVTTEIYTPS